MEEKESTRKMVESNLRSVTQSCKGGVPLERLERDYRELLGTPIPYRNLGFNTLRDMISSMPHVIQMTKGKTGHILIEGVADETTEHIVKMISKQRDTRSKRSSGQRQRLYRMQPSRSASSRSSFPQARRYPVQPKYLRTSPREHPRKPAFVPTKPSYMSSSQNARESPIRQINYASNKTTFELPPRFQRRKEVDVAQSSKENKPTQELSPEYRSVSIRPAAGRPIIGRPFQDGSSVIRSIQDSSSVIRRVQDSSSVVRQPVDPLSAVSDDSNLLTIREGSPSKKIPSPKPKQEKSMQLPPPPLPMAHLTAKAYIEEYAAMHGLPFSYYTRPIGQKERNFLSILTLNTMKFKTFPIDKPTVAQAEELAAQIAREKIEEKAKEKTYEKTSIATQEEINELMERIEEIIKEKPNGVWNSYCENKYRAKHQQELPDLWLSLVRQHLSGVIEVEIPDRINVPKDACILRMVKPPSGTATPTSTSSGMSNPLDEDPLSELNQETSNIILHEVLNPLLPDESEWGVFVTNVSDEMQISVRLIDHDDGFLEFHEGLTASYESSSFHVQQVIVGKLYIMKDQQNICNRVCVKDIFFDTNEVRCYFVDVGETSMVNISQLREIDPRFETLPGQAISLRLAELEDYKKLIDADQLCEQILDKSFVAKIVNQDGNDITAILYDTSLDLAVNINEMLKKAAVCKALSFNMPECGSLVRCNVTAVTPDGDVFLRIVRPYFGLLEEELEKLIPEFEQQIACYRLKSFPAENMYVAKYIDSLWYRARLMNEVEPGATEVEVYYVDYGNTSFVPLDQICELEPISKAMADIQFQAVPCLLSEIPAHWRWTDDAVKKLYELVPDNQEIIVKVDYPATENLPIRVSLYKRNEDAAIISINQTLAFDKELFQEEAIAQASPSLVRPNTLMSESGLLSRYIPDVAVPAEVHMAKRQNFDTNQFQCIWAPTPEVDNEPFVAQKDVVPLPVTPKIGEYFDVYIPWVANPWNFVVQPLDTSKAMKNLEAGMLEFYSCEDNICELPLCMLQVDEVYAVLHKDKVWYRGRLKQIIQEDPVLVTVHFVDYGDFSTVEASDVQSLYSQFKSLPCQAIKASLSGVRPVSDDWEPEHIFAFSKLISEKMMVSIIVNKHQNEELDFGFCSLELILIDTSQSEEKDTVIADELVNNNLALRV